jgi:hypothetical protein
MAQAIVTVTVNCHVWPLAFVPFAATLRFSSRVVLSIPHSAHAWFASALANVERNVIVFDAPCPSNPCASDRSRPSP